ncbi:MAG: hypothetical protein MZU91_01120 [Desulfosudis oleivorans]|nr:hypothetical protein [Desulfosudis oleivorans]
MPLSPRPSGRPAAALDEIDRRIIARHPGRPAAACRAPTRPWPSRLRCASSEVMRAHAAHARQRRDPPHRRGAQPLRARLPGQRHDGVGRAGRARRRARAQRSARSTSSRHCYRRPRHLPDWPYNLFAMVHGRDRAEVEAKVGRDRATLLGARPCRGTTTILVQAVANSSKKTGLAHLRDRAPLTSR